MPEVKAFIIFQVAINDRDGYGQYETAGQQEILNKFSGKLIGIEDAVDAVEGSWPFNRTVILEFPNKQLAQAWYASDEYQAVVGIRHGSAESNVVIVSGIPE